jgi:hypothetical protein
MQRFLEPLTAEQAQLQTLTLAQEVEKEVQQRRVEQQLRDAQPRRGPGRPKRERDSNSVLSSSVASTSQEERESSPKRKYTHWLTSPLVFDILRAVKENSGSARRAVAYLQSNSKHNINGRFNRVIRVITQINSAEADGVDVIVGLKDSLKMSSIKPKILDWVCQSWKSLTEEKLLIMKGWHSCVVSLFDVHDEQQRKKAVQAALQAQKPVDAVPELREDEPAEEEVDAEVNSEGYIEEESEDEEKTEKQIMKERVYGERRSTRDRQPAKQFGFQLNSSQLKFS